ncbi:MAG TPA: HAMP domain-containing sensor histidine kinase [Allocoleopsis sp.]
MQHFSLSALLSLALGLQVIGLVALLGYFMLHEHFHNLLTRFLIGGSILILSTGIGLGGLVTHQIVVQSQLNQNQKRKQLTEISKNRYFKQLEWELQVTKAEAARALEREQELRQLKSDFASMISHDVRTPLGCIQCYVELLRSDLNLTPEVCHQYFDRIDQIAEHLLNLMDQILLLGSAAADKLEVYPTVFNVQEFCQNLIETLQLYDKNQHLLLLKCAEGVEKVKLDQTLLWQILNNLLSNAIKYSPNHSSIELAVHHQNHAITFQIKDQGVGIPLESRSQVFKTFYRSSNVRDVKGTGLGLAIVKACVEAHKGRIQLNSEVGKGTTVTVSLPLR